MLLETNHEMALRQLVEIGANGFTRDEKLSRMLDVVLSIKGLSNQKGCLFLANSDASHLSMHVQRGLSKEVEERCAQVASGECLCGKAAVNGGIIYKPHVDDEHHHTDADDHGHYIVPIHFHEQLLGVLNIHIPAGQAHCKKAEEALAACARLMCMVIRMHEKIDAIEAARLQLAEEVEQRTQEIKQIARFSEENPSPVLSVDTALRIRYANPASRLLLEHWQCGVGDEVPDILKLYCEQAMHDGILLETQLDIGPVSFDFVFSTIGDREFLCIYATDITTLVEANKERQLLQQRHEQAQHLESLGVLAGGLAHDFNNMLMAVMGNADLLKLQLQEQDQVQKAQCLPLIDKIHKICKNAAVICRQMLDYAGKNQTKPKLLNVNDVIRDMNLLLRTTVAKHVNLHYALAERLPKVKLDEKQFQQVIVNLVLNACEALEGKEGLVTIHTNYVRVDEYYLAQLATSEKVEPGLFVEIKVEDNGSGMDDDVRHRMFEPFFTTRFVGRGMGLSVVEGVVRSHHGVINVYSEQGHGTVMKLLLPAAEPAKSKLLAESPSPVVAHGEKILVVDDDAGVREFLVTILEHFGYACYQAENGEEGLRVFEANRADIGLAIVDMSMPVMDGKATLKALHNIDVSLPVLMISGYTEEDISSQIEGQSGFLSKPFKPEALKISVDNIFSKRHGS